MHVFPPIFTSFQNNSLFFFPFFISVLFSVLVSPCSNGFWQFDVLQAIAITIFLILQLLWCGFWFSVTTSACQQASHSLEQKLLQDELTFSAQSLEQRFLQETLAAFNGKWVLALIRMLTVLTIYEWDSISFSGQS